MEFTAIILEWLFVAFGIVRSPDKYVTRNFGSIYQARVQVFGLSVYAYADSTRNLQKSVTQMMKPKVDIRQEPLHNTQPAWTEGRIGRA